MFKKKLCSFGLTIFSFLPLVNSNLVCVKALPPHEILADMDPEYMLHDFNTHLFTTFTKNMIRRIREIKNLLNEPISLSPEDRIALTSKADQTLSCLKELQDLILCSVELYRGMNSLGEPSELNKIKRSELKSKNIGKQIQIIALFCNAVSGIDIPDTIPYKTARNLTHYNFNGFDIFLTGGLDVPHLLKYDLAGYHSFCSFVNYGEFSGKKIKDLPLDDLRNLVFGACKHIHTLALFSISQLLMEHLGKELCFLNDQVSE